MKYLFFILFCLSLTACIYEEKPTIKVGILHSLTGTMAINEKPVVDAVQLAINEINASGGVLGQQLEAVIFDGQSDPNTFTLGAEKLITEDKVSVIFGCWTSACRKMIKPIIEKHDHLLFYPVQYEGLEHSANIIYTGSTPNQQITPAVKWSKDKFGSRFYLATSDYVFPRATNTQIKYQLTALGATVVGEKYLPLGSQDVDAMVKDIRHSKADIILNTINGDSNLAFFNALQRQGNKTPVLSFNISETELIHLDEKVITGHYVASSYFQRIPSKINKQFVDNFKQSFGKDRSINAAIEAAYIGVHLWTNTVKNANITTPSSIRLTLKGMSLDAPEGKITVSSLNNHLWKPLYIAQIQSNKQFDIIWKTSSPIRPKPYPSYFSPQQWQLYLDNLFKSWGGNWKASSQPNTRG